MCTLQTCCGKADSVQHVLVGKLWLSSCSVLPVYVSQAALCSRFSVGHYPTLRFGKPTDFVVGKEGKLEDYNGVRAEKEIIEWVGKLLSTWVALPCCLNTILHGQLVLYAPACHQLRSHIVVSFAGVLVTMRTGPCTCVPLFCLLTRAELRISMSGMCRAYDYNPDKGGEASQQEAPGVQVSTTDAPKVPQHVRHFVLPCVAQSVKMLHCYVPMLSCFAWRVCNRHHSLTS